MKTTTLILTTILCALLAFTAIAEVPQIIAYQGRLLDNAGDPVADGAYLITFRIYDDPSAGVTLWNSGIRQLNAVDGFIAYNLGDTTVIPDALFATDTNLWLGIKIGVDAEMTPRARLASVGHAYHALRADSTNWGGIVGIPADIADGDDNSGGDVTGVIAGSGLSVTSGGGPVPTISVATSGITATHIGASAVGTSEIADGSVTGTDIANGTITSTDIAVESNCTHVGYF